MNYRPLLPAQLAAQRRIDAQNAGKTQPEQRVVEPDKPTVSHGPVDTPLDLIREAKC